MAAPSSNAPHLPSLHLHKATFTRHAASEDDTTVLRSPRAHSSPLATPTPSFGPDPSFATTRQRPRPPQGTLDPISCPSTNIYGHSLAPSSPEAPLSYSRSGSPSYLDRTTSKPLLTPTSLRRSRIRPPYPCSVPTGIFSIVCVLLLISILRRLVGPDTPESVPSSACEAQYDTLTPHSHSVHHLHGEMGDFPMHTARPSIALVTMSDTRRIPMPKKLAYLTGIQAGKSVDILEVVWQNRQEYADRHGYTLVNASHLLKPDRPASWYKIKMVQSVLESYDWVFYLDPDAWITNPEIPLEAVIPGPGGGDFVVTEDAAGVNAGAWLVRNCDWSRNFLQRWWSMDSFIQPPGSTRSGDNHALIHLIATMPPEERKRRVAIPPQCAFNSYLWRSSFRQWVRWITAGRRIRAGIWRPGHLLVHLAGWDNYKGLLQLQKLFVSNHDLARRSSSNLNIQPQRLSRKDLPGVYSNDNTGDTGKPVIGMNGHQPGPANSMRGSGSVRNTGDLPEGQLNTPGKQTGSATGAIQDQVQAEITGTGTGFAVRTGKSQGLRGFAKQSARPRVMLQGKGFETQGSSSVDADENVKNEKEERAAEGGRKMHEPLVHSLDHPPIQFEVKSSLSAPQEARWNKFIASWREKVQSGGVLSAEDSSHHRSFSDHYHRPAWMNGVALPEDSAVISTADEEEVKNLPEITADRVQEVVGVRLPRDGLQSKLQREQWLQAAAEAT